MIRLLDIILSLAILIVCSPIFFVLSIAITLTSGFPFVFRQTRVGLKGKEFKIIKFRTMYRDAEQRGQLTVGMRDPRITPLGYFLRKHKLDELPQLWNVLVGEMSFVGPRPEVKKYVKLYTPEQLQLLNVRPGITDHASIYFSNENHIMGQHSDPEKAYIEIVMQEKLRLSKRYLDDPSVRHYFWLIWMTIKKVVM